MASEWWSHPYQPFCLINHFLGLLCGLPNLVFQKSNVKFSISHWSLDAQISWHVCLHSSSRLYQSAMNLSMQSFCCCSYCIRVWTIVSNDLCSFLVIALSSSISLRCLASFVQVVLSSWVTFFWASPTWRFHMHNSFYILSCSSWGRPRDVLRPIFLNFLSNTLISSFNLFLSSLAVP